MKCFTFNKKMNPIIFHTTLQLFKYVTRPHIVKSFVNHKYFESSMLKQQAKGFIFTTTTFLRQKDKDCV